MTIPISPIGAPIVVVFLILLAVFGGYVIFKNLDQQDREAQNKKKTK